MNLRVLAITVGIVALAALAVWDWKEPGPPAPAKAAAQAQPAAAQAPAADLQRNPERSAYFRASPGPVRRLPMTQASTDQLVWMWVSP